MSIYKCLNDIDTNNLLSISIVQQDQ